MIVVLLVLASLGVYGAVATVATVRADGYGPVPTRES
jgi:hypothetical protein